MTVTCTYIQVHVGVLIIVQTYCTCTCIQSTTKQTSIVYSFLNSIATQKTYNAHVVIIYNYM